MNFIEELLRISPDNGSGLLELSYILTACIFTGALVLISRGGRRKQSKRFPNGCGKRRGSMLR